mgnify:FL=1
MSMRTIAREFIAIISPPLLYGLLCLPLTGMLLAQYPNAVNNLGGTHNTSLVIAIEFIQCATLMICGGVIYFIAGQQPRYKMLQTGVVIEMLAIAIWVEVQYWGAMPVWHHFVFFTLIVCGIPMGSHLANRWRSTRA